MYGKIGKFRYTPEVEDVILDIPSEEVKNRKDEILQAVYCLCGKNNKIKRYMGEDLGDKFSKFFPYLQKQPKKGMHLEALEQFIFVTPGVFADSTEVLPPKTLEHMAAAVGAENAKILVKIVEKFGERGLSFWIDTAFLKNRFINQKGKDTLIHIPIFK